MPNRPGAYEDVAFSADGIVLRGWLRVPEGEGPHPLVILAHGLGGLKEWTIPDVADALIGAGIGAANPPLFGRKRIERGANPKRLRLESTG